MGLKSLRLPTDFIIVPDGGEGVRTELHGLSLPDISILVRLHGPSLNKIFDKVKERASADELELDLVELVRDLATDAPAIMAEIIALAAHEPDAVEEARRLPMGLQLEAIEKIMRLTFEAEGGVKNFAETVIRIAKKLTLGLEELNQSPSLSLPTGTEPSSAV